MRKKLKMKTMYIKPTSEAIYIGMMPMMSYSLKETEDNILHNSSTQTDTNGPGIGGDTQTEPDGDITDAAKRYGWYTGEFGE